MSEMARRREEGEGGGRMEMEEEEGFCGMLVTEIGSRLGGDVWQRGNQ